MSKFEDEEYWSDSVSNIASEFEVPPLTAAAWERNIKDVETLEETLEKNGPDNYLDLIRRREWIPHERENCEEEWIGPLKQWCTKRAKDVYLVSDSEWENFRSDHRVSGYMNLGSGWRGVALTEGSTKRPAEDTVHGISWTDEMAALQEEIERKEDWVKYEMGRLDPEWIGLTRELKSVEKKLIEIYRDYLENVDRQVNYKKDKIIELKRAFPYLRANAELVVEATDSSHSYVNKFKYIPEKGVSNRRVKGKLRNDVLQRDNQICVSCGSEEDLKVHHISPHGQGGENAMENLATLCADCHFYAHGGGQPIDDGRYTTASWDSVEYDDHAEFWDEWIHQNFEDRATKGFNRRDVDP